VTQLSLFLRVCIAATILAVFSCIGVNAQGCSNLTLSASVTSGCSPLFVKFTVTGAPGGSTYSWDFGNGLVPGHDTASKIFTNAGKYTIRLQVVLPGNVICNINRTDYIEVLPSPKPIIGVVPGRRVCN